MGIFKPTLLCFLSLAANAATDFPDKEKILNVLNANSYFTVTGSRVWQETSLQPDSFNTVILLDNDSKWNSAGVTDQQLLKSSRIFRACKVSAQKALIVNVTFTKAGLDILANEMPNPSLGPAEIPIAKGGLPSDVMTGFLVKNRTKGRDVAYAYNRASVDRAAQSGQDWRALLYTYWVSDKYITNPNNPQYAESYSTMAHELTHIMGNVGHTDTFPNLMTNSERPGAKSGDLSPEQCAEIIKNMLR